MVRGYERLGIQETADGIRIGATVRHAQVEHSTQVQQCAPLLFQAMPWVAHPPIRARGTYGGSVSLSDPAAEAPAATLAHAATLVVRSSRGERRIAADDFFLGLYQTALEPGEILVGAHFKRPGPNERFVFREFARRSGDFATAGVAIQAVMDKARVQSRDRCHQQRVAIGLALWRLRPACSRGWVLRPVISSRWAWSPPFRWC